MTIRTPVPRRVAAALTAGLVAAAASLTVVPTAQAAVPAGLKLVETKRSLFGSHQWYRQTYQGLPVVGGYYVRHLDSSGHLDQVVDGRRAVGTVSVRPAVTKAAATARAVDAVTSRAARTTGRKNGAYTPAADQSSTSLAVLGGASPRLVWQVVTRSAEGSARTLVDAQDGSTVAVRTLSRSVTGKGRVFDPNPVVTLEDESLKDKNDANQAVLWPAQRTCRCATCPGRTRSPASTSASPRRSAGWRSRTRRRTCTCARATSSSR